MLLVVGPTGRELQVQIGRNTVTDHVPQTLDKHS